MRFIEWIEKVLRYMCFILIIEIVLVCFLQVITRYGLNFTYRWVEELAIWSMIWMIYLGSVLAINTGQHPRIDALLNILPYKTKNIIEACNCLICAGITAVLSYQTINVMIFSFPIRSTGMGVSFALLYGSFLVGGVLMMIFFLIKAFHFLKCFQLKEEVS